MIDNRAIISKDAQIGNNCEIGPNAYIGENVILGDNVKVCANAYIEHSTIGEGTIISPFASVGTPPQDLGYKNEPTKVIVGKNCQIREYATIHRASGEGKSTVIGDKCLLMVSSHVAHNCVLDDEVILANLVTLGGHIKVGFGAFVGGMSVFHQNIRIGKMSIVSGFSAARQDILPFSKGEGRPPVPRALNVVALKRRGVALEDRTNLNKAFKILISPDLNTTQAIDKIKSEVQNNKYIEELIEFVQTSKRGVTLHSHKKGYQSLEDEE
ncbi:MAG: acyl-ACP--UDP-N-acetylglucosamine O-acyltransferase [Candidatus Gastranaerophilales bacterium]|nr:acyl-ACP--UDP-N-acetylglucosamine O-acyltransferase [Candidatus Gastranaerophilales bacterium]